MNTQSPEERYRTEVAEQSGRLLYLALRRLVDYIEEKCDKDGMAVISQSSGRVYQAQAALSMAEKGEIYIVGNPPRNYCPIHCPVCGGDEKHEANCVQCGRIPELCDCPKTGGEK